MKSFKRNKIINLKNLGRCKILRFAKIKNNIKDNKSNIEFYIDILDGFKHKSYATYSFILKNLN